MLEEYIEVRLYRFLYNNRIEDGKKYVRENILPWLLENLDQDDWTRDGVTNYSYRFAFKHEADAVAFKLRFGL
jgi:hypothetical protein